jgi:hypothetical protein
MLDLLALCIHLSFVPYMLHAPPISSLF